MNCDHNLFLALNFDGGPFMDRLMLTVSGTTMWLPLYALILWLVWRRDGWRNVILFTALMIAALVLSDMISGIFKHNGVLGGLLPDFEPRWRPMFTPALEGLEIAPDSLRKLRWLTPDSLAAAGVTHDWVVHVPVEAVSGRFGTVSAHAAVIVTLAVLSASVIRRRWFTGLMVLSTLLICYSRIYLGKHYPMDLVWGTAVGIALGLAAFWAYRRLSRQKKELQLQLLFRQYHADSVPARLLAASGIPGKNFIRIFDSISDMGTINCPNCDFSVAALVVRVSTQKAMVSSSSAVHS